MTGTKDWSSHQPEVAGSYFPSVSYARQKISGRHKETRTEQRSHRGKDLQAWKIGSSLSIKNGAHDWQSSEASREQKSAIY